MSPSKHELLNPLNVSFFKFLVQTCKVSASILGGIHVLLRRPSYDNLKRFIPHVYPSTEFKLKLFPGKMLLLSKKFVEIRSGKIIQL